jgi:hypothetical protein
MVLVQNKLEQLGITPSAAKQGRLSEQPLEDGSDSCGWNAGTGDLAILVTHPKTSPSD